MRETWVWSLGWEDPLEKGMATHSSILAWRIPGQRSLVGYSHSGVSKSRTRLSDFTSLHFIVMGFPGGLAGKESAWNVGDLGSIPGLGRFPGEGNREWLPIPVFWPGEFHGLYNPRGCKESDMTERLSHSSDSNVQPTLRTVVKVFMTIPCCF